MNFLIRVLLVNLFSIFSVLYAQPPQPTLGSAGQDRGTTPLWQCCNNGAAENLQASDTCRSGDYQNGCVDRYIIARQCVIFTRDNVLCYGASRYCREGASDYPRFYAVNYPLVVAPTSLTFTAYYGAGNPASQNLSITNGVELRWPSVDPSMPWSATETLDWLTLSVGSGTLSGTTSANTVVSVNTAGKSPGIYTGTIHFTSSKVSAYQPTDVPVTLRLLMPISVSISGPTSLLSGQVGTWTASVTGGSLPIHYQWYYYPVCPDAAGPSSPSPLKPTCGYWYTNGTDNYQWSHQDTYDFMVKCEVTDNLGSSATSNTIYVTVAGGLAKESSAILGDATVDTKDKVDGLVAPEIFPNPFNPVTTLRFALTERTEVSLAIYDMLGRQLAILAKGELEPGYHSYSWDASSLPSGVYFAHFCSNTGNAKPSVTKITKLLLLK